MPRNICESGQCKNRVREFVCNDDGSMVCIVCGTVDNNSNTFSNDITFEGSGGEKRVSGTFVRSIAAEFSESRERTINRGRDEIYKLVLELDIEGGDSIVDEACHFYRIALDRNFTKAHGVPLVAAACLYIVCRGNKKQYLLIDFSQALTVNVYALGVVFLKLCQVLRLEEHPIVRNCVDPSLFMDRFTHALFEQLKLNLNQIHLKEVRDTATKILVSMKRDWMQTGRKPSGVCGAALYISALSHGLQCSKLNIGKIVHICEGTLMKRLVEFKNTESGSLTVEELTAKAAEFEKEAIQGPPTQGELLCEHKGSSSRPHFKNGLCLDCYKAFIDLSGGFQGTDPPSFQRAEKKRMEAKLAAEKKAQEEEEEEETNLFDDVTQNTGAPSKHQTVEDNTDSLDGDETVLLTGIEDSEIDGYLNNEDEQRLKKIIWEEMNKEYLEEQRLKQANAQNGSDASKPKRSERKKAADEKDAVPAKNAAEAAAQMLSKKRSSSRINYDVLNGLFGDPVDNAKKQRTEPIMDDDHEQEGDQYEDDEYENGSRANGDEGIYEGEYNDGYGEGNGYGGEAYDYDVW